MDALTHITNTHIVAIVRLETYASAVKVAQALIAGGITVVEFTLTGSGAFEAISACRETLGETALIGVGTALSASDAQQAISAGAQFVVTPAVRTSVIDVCNKHAVPVLCGALTPSEALQAHERGADMIKIFPARAFGPAYIKDLLAPLPMLKLVPTGGVSADNARAYLDAGAVAVGMGGNLVSASAVANKDWGQITTAARECVLSVGGPTGRSAPPGSA